MLYFIHIDLSVYHLESFSRSARASLSPLTFPCHARRRKIEAIWIFQRINDFLQVPHRIWSQTLFQYLFKVRVLVQHPMQARLCIISRVRAAILRQPCNGRQEFVRDVFAAREGLADAHPLDGVGQEPGYSRAYHGTFVKHSLGGDDENDFGWIRILDDGIESNIAIFSQEFIGVTGFQDQGQHHLFQLRLHASLEMDE